MLRIYFLTGFDFLKGLKPFLGPDLYPLNFVWLIKFHKLKKENLTFFKHL